MRDYAKRSPSEFNEDPKRNKIWVIIIAVVLFFALITYALKHSVLKTTIKNFIATHQHSLQHQPLDTKNIQLPKPDIITKKQIAKTKSLVSKKSASDQMQYDFYKLLPEMTVNVPSASTVATTQPAAASLQNSASFVLQIAALQNPNDAKTLQNQLLQAGYHAFIQSYLANQKTWYRVIIGPFDSLSEAQNQQLKLDGQNVEALLLKVK